MAPSTASAASASRRPALTSERSSAAACSGGELGPVRTRLAHRLVGVGRGQDARRTGDRPARFALRIAGAVESLAVLRRDRAEGREQPRRAQHALREVRVQPDALALARAQRSALVPDGVGHAEAAEVVNETRAAERADVTLGEPEDRAGLRRQVGDGA